MTVFEDKHSETQQSKPRMLKIRALAIDSI